MILKAKRMPSIEIARLDNLVEEVIRENPGQRYGALWPLVSAKWEGYKVEFDRMIDRSLQRLRKENRVHVAKMRWYHGPA